jgi:hypothetical protein
MKVTKGYEIIPDLICVLCEHEWTACLEMIEIDIDTHKEYLLDDFTMCPNCLMITPIIRNEDDERLS